jgi:spore germination protein YaaH
MFASVAWRTCLRCAGALSGCVLAASCGTTPEVATKPSSAAAAAALRAAGDHRFCGWLHGSSADPTFTELAYDTFAQHAGELDAVHPVWWRVDSPTSIVNHPLDQATPYPGFHDARVLQNTTPGGARTKLVPMIAASERPDYVHVHRMINDPDLRAQHIRAVTEIAADHGYDGIDIDYEHIDPNHLGSDMRSGETKMTERRAFSAFIAELARALHDAGKTLSLAVPVTDPPDSVYDYEALSAAADNVHVMAYDFHYEGDSHAGTVAPLSWVEHCAAYAGAIDGGRRRSKFLLGLPNYGLVGPEAPRPGGEVTTCETSLGCADLVGGVYAAHTDHMARCPSRDGEDIDAGRSPNGVLPSGDRVFFEDLGSLEERVEVAESAGLGGITYWAIGGEPDRPGRRTFFQMVRGHFPR